MSPVRLYTAPRLIFTYLCGQSGIIDPDRVECLEGTQACALCARSTHQLFWWRPQPVGFQPQVPLVGVAPSNSNDGVYEFLYAPQLFVITEMEDVGRSASVAVRTDASILSCLVQVGAEKTLHTRAQTRMPRRAMARSMAHNLPQEALARQQRKCL